MTKNNKDNVLVAEVSQRGADYETSQVQSSSKRRWRVAVVDVGVTVAMVAMVLVALDLLASSDTGSNVVGDAVGAQAAIVSQPKKMSDNLEKLQLSASSRAAVTADGSSAKSMLPAKTSSHLDTVAYVEGDEGRERDLVLVGQGWVEDVAVLRIGQRVARGQLLLTIYSPALVDAQLEYLAALANNDALVMRESIDRLTVYGQTMAQINALSHKENIDGIVEVFAPSDGMVSAVYVEAGEFVPMAASLVGLVDMTSIWMVTELSMKDAEGVRPGRRVDATIPKRDEPLVGIVEYVDYPARQGGGRVTVRLRFDGIQRQLVSRNYADVRIYTGRVIPKVADDATS